jgi:hypothetical protein
MTGVVISIVRTLAGYVVGAALALPIAPQLEAAAGVTAQQARAGLTGGLVLVLGTLYYVIVRRLEARWPALGRLLGVAVPPSYSVPACGRFASAAEMAGALGAELVDGEPAEHSAP